MEEYHAKITRFLVGGIRRLHDPVAFRRNRPGRGFHPDQPHRAEPGHASRIPYPERLRLRWRKSVPGPALDRSPAGTKGFALTVYDPDAPTGSGWWHWVVFNIPAAVNRLPEGAGSKGGHLPDGAVQSRTDFGAPGYGGACPPEGHGNHRYIFTVHALDVEKLDLPPESSAAMVGFMVNAHTLGKASFTAVYGR